MSQAGRFFVDIETLEGNAGGSVSPTNGEIDIVGTTPVTVTGNPLTSTLTISVAGSVATQYDTDLGTAVPVAHVLNVKGFHNINTIGVANTVTVRGNNTVTLGDIAPVVGNSLTLTTGNETITAGNLNITSGDINMTSGDLTLSAGDINMTAGDLTLSAGDASITGSLAVSTLTDHGILIGHGAGNITSSTLTNGQLLIGKTGAFDPVAAVMTSTGATIAITNGAGSINLETGPSIPKSFPTDAGTAVPAFGDLNILGGTNIGTTGVGNTVTANLDAALTGITSITGTNGCSFQTGTTAADTLLLKAYNNTTSSYDTFATLTANLIPTFDLATTTTLGGQYIYRAGGTDVPVADGGTGVSTFTDHGILMGNGVGVVQVTAEPSDGQLLIGRTGNFPLLASLSAGANITITPGAGTITIAAVGLTDVTYTNVAVTPYVAIATDEYLSVDTSALAITVKLPDAATLGHIYIIKDRTGTAATRNITVTTVTGAVLFDGAATYVMNTDYQAIQVVGNGTSYEIF